MTNVSNIGLNYQLTASLEYEKATLESLNQELATGQVSSNLTDYSPTDAKNIVDYQNSITINQSYLATLNTVQSRLTLYNTTMGDMEQVASNAAGLAAGNQSYNATNASNIQAQAQSYLSQVADDLNQSLGGRYLYSGTRYTTQPVTNNTSVLFGAPQSIITNGSTLPNYDSEYAAVGTSKVNYGAALPGSASVGSVLSATTQTVYDSAGGSHTLSYQWTKASSSQWDLSVSSPDATYTTVVPFTFDSTTGSLSAISNYSSSNAAPSPYTVGTPTGTGYSADVNVSMTFSNDTSPQSIDLNFGSYGLSNGTNSLTQASSASTINQTLFSQNGKATTTDDSNAYTADTIAIDTSASITYGVSSDNPSFQQLINGLRYMNAAVTAGNSGDTATYQTDMQQASTLLKNGLAGIQTLNSSVANNQNALSQAASSQTNSITNLQDSLSTIQQADTTQVATEITLLQTQIQASYTTTAALEKLSLANYI
jgi:flagellar hook-associated protein 3 FlgL